jgi:hypothetical protein
MKRTVLITLACAAIAVIPHTSLASGSAPGRSMKAKAATGTSMQDAQYALGQQVYEGSAPMAANAGSMSDQKAKLAKIAGMVPDAGKGKALQALAGKLSSEQLSALEYFVSKRFKM